MVYNERTTNDLKRSLKDIKNNTPLLLIGGAVVYFKQRFKGKIYNLRTNEEVRDFVSEFSGVVIPGPIIIEDLGNLSSQGSFLLLKLVEEAKYPIILLSYQDRVSSILLSRCKKVIKLPQSEDVSCKMFDAARGLEYIDSYLQENTTIDDRDRLLAETSPSLYRIEKSLKNTRNKDKIVILLS